VVSRSSLRLVSNLFSDVRISWLILARNPERHFSAAMVLLRASTSSTSSAFAE
jgi:hypothetical protein